MTEKYRWARRSKKGKLHALKSDEHTTYCGIDMETKGERFWFIVPAAKICWSCEKLLERGAEKRQE